MNRPVDPIDKLSRSVCVFILVFILANVVIWAVDQANAYIKHKDPISRLMSDQALQYIYPNHSKAEVNQIYNESWNRELVYEDFVQFKEGAFEGQYVNVSEHGFRLVKNQGPWPPERGNHNIFIFGGSQAFNYGIADDETVASRLQEIIRAKRGDDKTCVYNFGRGSYFSTQERILFEQLLLDGYLPDLVLFIHGGNDFSRLRDDLEFSNDIRHYLESPWIQRFMLLMDNLPIMKLYLGIKLRLSAGRDPAHVQRVSNLEDAGQTQTKASSEFIKVVVGRANRYLNNLRMIEATAKAYDIQSAFVFAPAAFYGLEPKYDLFGKNRLAVKGKIGNGGYSLMKTILDRGGMGTNFIWMGDYLRNKTEPLFVDTGHYTAKLAKEVAEVIAGELEERGLSSAEKKLRSSDLVAGFLRTPQPVSSR